MRKFIALMVFAAGLGGPAGAASVVHTLSDTTRITHAHDAINNLPDQVNQLRSEVKILQSQVSALQNSNIDQSGVSDVQLWPVGTGG